MSAAGGAVRSGGNVLAFAGAAPKGFAEDERGLPLTLDDGARAILEAQVTQLIRAAAFLARDPAAVRGDRPMPRRVMGNGLRELDIFLVDIVGQAVGQRSERRVYCAAEAWRRSGPGIGLAARHHAALVQLRAAQNRMAFEPARLWIGPPYPLALACAAYSALALMVLERVKVR
ncbi:hypothetical protein C1T17_04625 [Sphingobium sp. SCG-1]|uniref:hypothetical protein n=1 Tax=Sphingobium sp. SCG-1 TaxID=2072936 RepID=UPI000CD6B054|nr:hypothetical protein [Sphingobium sp. SCG-1]AUW57495.1 hypothetical protein C1T17_04625 [Sphingobium sp. SCG-1]